MKATRVLLLALLIMIGQLACAQATVKNSSGEEMEVTSSRGTVVIRPGQQKTIPWLPSSGTTDVTVRTRSANGAPRVERMTISTQNGVGTMKPIERQTGRKSQTTSATSSVTSSQSVQNVEIKTTGIKTLDLIVENQSGHRFVIVGKQGDPFVGLALADKAISSSQRVPTGLHQLAALLDMDPEGQSTGKNFAQAVIKFIVVESDEKIVIREENVTQIAGEVVKARLRSLFPFKIVIVSSGNMQGKAIRPRGFLRGINTFSTGFNTMSIQYFKDGIKYQSDVEFIVTREEKIIAVGESALRNTVAIGVPPGSQGGYSTF